MCEIGNSEKDIVYLIPREELDLIIHSLKALQTGVESIRQQFAAGRELPTGYIRPVEFMEAVGIKRTKFNSLIANNKIKTIKKGRKVYIPATEISRYFTDPHIE